MSRRCCSIVRVASGGEARGVVGVSWGGWDGIGSGPPSLGCRWVHCTAPRQTWRQESWLELWDGGSDGWVGGLVG